MADFIPFNVSVFRGDGRAIQFRGWNVGGVPTDITSWTIFHTAKKRIEDSDNDALIMRDSVNDPTAIVKYDSDAHGFPDSFTVNYLPADTTDMNPRDYEQDVQIIQGSGAPRTYAFGTLNIKGDVTRRITTA